MIAAERSGAPTVYVRSALGAPLAFLADRKINKLCAINPRLRFDSPLPSPRSILSGQLSVLSSKNKAATAVNTAQSALTFDFQVPTND